MPDDSGTPDGTPDAPDAPATQSPADAPATFTPAPPVDLDPGYTPGGIPTFESVRDKIETRFGTAIGATELAEGSAEAQTAAQQYEAREQAAAERLEQIRKSMHQDDH